MIGCLFIHGYTGGPYEIEPLANYLKEETNWQVHVPTLPGHGDPLELDGISHEKWLLAAEYSLERMKDELETIYVIGFSMGGMIAAYLAGKYNIDKLVLLAPSRKYISLRKVTRKIGEVIADGIRGNLEDNRFFTNYKQKRGEVPLKANIEFTKLVNYTKPFLKEINSPVLIAHGRQDSIVPVNSVYSLDEEIQSDQKQIVLFERSDHMICLGEDRHILNNIVHSFLTEEK